MARWPARASARGVQPRSMPEGASARLNEGRRSPPKGLSYPLIPRPEGCFSSSSLREGSVERVSSPRSYSRRGSRPLRRGRPLPWACPDTGRKSKDSRRNFPSNSIPPLDPRRGGECAETLAPEDQLCPLPSWGRGDIALSGTGLPSGGVYPCGVNLKEGDHTVGGVPGPCAVWGECARPGLEWTKAVPLPRWGRHSLSLLGTQFLSVPRSWRPAGRRGGASFRWGIWHLFTLRRIRLRRPIPGAAPLLPAAR